MIKPLNTFFRLTLSCNDPNKKITSKILKYFKNYNLKTTKLNSFHIWCETLDIFLGKQPLSAENLNKVRKLRHNMNYYTIENLAKGHMSKS